MHKTHVALPIETREKVIAVLSARLVDVVDMAQQAKMAHWNVRGPHFIGLHELFDKVAETAIEHADMIAERIAQLGGIVRANIQEVAKGTKLPVFSSDLTKDVDVLKTLVDSMAAFANAARKDIDATADLGDQGSSDMLTDIVRDTDKHMWFVEAHLQ